MNDKNTLIERVHKIRTKDGKPIKGNPRAVLVARKVTPNTYAIGWSLCSKNDQFDMNTGVTLAFGRTLGRTLFDEPTPPHSLVNSIIRFDKRCQRYFKNSTMSGKKEFLDKLQPF